METEQQILTEDSQPAAGLGVDIIEIARMEQALKRTPRLAQRMFTDQERAYAFGKARPAVHLALFFAAREAVLKALGCGFAGMNWTDVEVSHDRFGRPVPLLHGHAAEVAAAQGVVEVQLSLSYTHSVGVASAVAIKEQDRPRREEKLDPRAELAKQFKEMRALLDDLDNRLTEMDDNAEAEQAAGEPEAPGAPQIEETADEHTPASNPS
ncbi:MAG: holo-ACP synthase [Coriobacteriales bacterium]|jgi:holo-[acyl-carrier protein] synthase|nr:holo-ACP synthase [Coriobacteriales bacterium]